MIAPLGVVQKKKPSGSHSKSLHALHCVALCVCIGVCIYLNVSVKPYEEDFDAVDRYGVFPTIILYAWKCLPLFLIPVCCFQLFGLVFYNSFREKVPLKASPARKAPYICFRIVTRGNYPQLVKDNLNVNIGVCRKAGITNFCFEVVTDNGINLPESQLVREIVVPSTYVTKTGAKFKARALQYCIEPSVNKLRDSDWVAHLDEETLLTVNSVNGILNFANDGRHQFGQGVITYASGRIVNYLTTLSDSYRVADDCGKLRCQLSVFHKPIFGWKGSYVVTRHDAERKISWDHGPEGSICEDAYFGMLAAQAGYSFNFIEGEMLEKSPFTTKDLVHQRKRWLEGLLLVVHSKKIRLLYKVPLATVVYSWALSPLLLAGVFVALLFPLPRNTSLDVIFAIMLALNIYMNIFGVVIMFRRKCRDNAFLLLLCCIGGCLTIPYTLVVQAASVFLLIFGKKKGFFIVNKQTTPVDQSLENGNANIATVSQMVHNTSTTLGAVVPNVKNVHLANVSLKKNERNMEKCISRSTESCGDVRVEVPDGKRPVRRIVTRRWSQ